MQHSVVDDSIADHEFYLGKYSYSVIFQNNFLTNKAFLKYATCTRTCTLTACVLEH